jgi:hypothetical protein
VGDIVFDTLRIGDPGVSDLRLARIRLGDQRKRRGRPHFGDKSGHILAVQRAVGADGGRSRFFQSGQTRRDAVAHDGEIAPGKAVERQGREHGTSGLPGRPESAESLPEIVLGFDEQKIHTAFREGLGLEGIRFFKLGFRALALRGQKSARRTQAPTDESAAGTDGDGDFRGGTVELLGPVLQTVRGQFDRCSAEAVGQDGIRSGLEIGGVNAADFVGTIGVPQFGRIAGRKPFLKKLGAHGAVKKDNSSGGKFEKG